MLVRIRAIVVVVSTEFTKGSNRLPVQVKIVVLHLEKGLSGVHDAVSDDGLNDDWDAIFVINRGGFCLEVAHAQVHRHFFVTGGVPCKARYACSTYVFATQGKNKGSVCLDRVEARFNAAESAKNDWNNQSK